MNSKHEKITLQIAGFNVRINFKKTYWQYLKRKHGKNIYQRYKGFILNKKPKKIDFIIDFIHYSRILFHKKKAQNKDQYFIKFYEVINENKIITQYFIGEFEFQLIIEFILYQLLNKKGALLHSSAIYHNGKAILFLGASGSGKSTVVNLLKDKYPILADDNVIIRKKDNEFFCYQSPFVEKAWRTPKSSSGYLIKKVFLLKKAKYCRFKKIHKKDHQLLNFIRYFWIEKDSMHKQLSFVEYFFKKYNNFYFLSFNKNKKELPRLFRRLE